MLPLDTLISWYRTYADDLRAARDEQRELLAQRAMRPRLDDVEAEISYLTIRALRPRTVLEIGSARGWSTTWLLRALHDNGAAGDRAGVLHTFDLTDDAVRTVPPALSAGRWRFTRGDVRRGTLPTTPGSCSSTRHTRRGSPAGTPPRSSNGSVPAPPSPSTTSSTAAARGRSARAPSCSAGCAATASAT